MGKLLQIRVSAWTYREEDVVRAWPALTALAWPRPQYPDEKRGVLELVTALENGLSFEDWPQAVAEGLREGIRARRRRQKGSGGSAFPVGTAQGQRAERNAGRGTCHIERTGAQALEGVLQGVTMLNKVMIIGRLGRDPELRYSQSGSPVCTLNIATDESYTDRDGNRVDRAEWHRVVVFQKAAENCSQLPDQGQPRVCGRQPANPQMAGQQGRTATPPKSRPSASSSSTSAAANRAVCPAARAAAKAATALPAVLRRLSREAAAVPSSARSSGRTITKTWALPFPPKPAAWTTCRSNRHPKGRDARLSFFLKAGIPFFSINTRLES